MELGVVPGYGPAKGDALMREPEIDKSRRAGCLGPRQREELLAALK